MVMFSKPLIALSVVVVPVPGSSQVQLMCTKEQVDRHNEFMNIAMLTDICLYELPFSCSSPQCMNWHKEITNALNCPDCIIRDGDGTDTNSYDKCILEADEEIVRAKKDEDGKDCGWVFDSPFD